MRIGSALVALSLVVVAPALAAPTNYAFDPAHSAATFTIKHLGISTVRGEFGKMKGTVELDRSNLRVSKVDFTGSTFAGGAFLGTPNSGTEASSRLARTDRSPKMASRLRSSGT